MKRVFVLLAAPAAAAALLAGATHLPPAPPVERVQVVVTLKARAGTPQVAREQAAFEERLEDEIPGAAVRWRYRTVLNGLSIVVPQRDVPRLAALPGVGELFESVRYRQRLNSSPQAIGAPELWAPGLANAGDGIKIAIIDDGVQQDHPFLSPAGYTMPPGFPKGQTQYTTAKVIVARAFPPPGATYADASLPYDAGASFHGTHVAGIAAGNNATRATYNNQTLTVSGVAPRAYIGNYKALTIPTPSFGLDGNSPEIAAAIEAAVNDGMNVINLSLGEPEIEPTRDIVVRALEGAAAAGVVPVVAAGNDFGDFGRGSVGSPANTPSAITVAAASESAVIAGFSSSGPTPLSAQMKPDVTAPGTDIVSSVPPSEGLWSAFNGTSMAAPHVAGAVALLKQRQPTWSVAQIKSALVLTGGPVYGDSTRRTEALTTRQGGGFVNLPRAVNPLVFAAPAGVSFGRMRPGATATRTVSLTDAGGGAGSWNVTVVEQQARDAAITVTAPPAVTVPGTLTVTATAATAATEAERTGFVVLTRGAETRRLPFWFLVDSPQLGAPAATLTRAGTYRGNTSRGRARVTVYRYPDNPAGVGVATALAGPEQVFRVRIRRPVANFGVVVTAGGVSPRVVFAGDENRLVGYTGLPLDINPYRDTWGRRRAIAGAVLPAPGLYDVVFDQAGRGRAFRFRLWIDDGTPPSLRLASPSARRGGRLVATARDAGAGVDPASIRAKLGDKQVSARLTGQRIAISVPDDVAPGRHTLTLTVSDYQETKNMENVARILPNTRTLTTSVTVR